MTSVSTKKLAEAVLRDIQSAIPPFEAKYDLTPVLAEVSIPMAKYVTQNEASFLRITWSPQDGLDYHIGQVVGFDKPGDSPPEYSIGTFARMSGVLCSAGVSGKSCSVADALRVAFDQIDATAAEFLRGDWSRRHELHATIEANCRSDL